MSVRVTFVGTGDAFGAGGRFQTCLLIDAPGIRFAVDFGATSLVALNKLGIEHNTIDAIILTHLHGDHCGGIPFLLTDAMLGAKRDRPLTIAGPRQTEAKLQAVNEALFPGMNVMKPKYILDYIEMEVMQPNSVCGLTVTPYPAAHTGGTNPTSLRIEVAGKVIAYSGDSDWTKHMPNVSREADLFICECYFHGRNVPFHLNYPTLKEHWHEIAAKRVILTHMSREMLPHTDAVPEECAHDGLVVEI
ncbi:MAG: MBL fold metallo-hydrolase [Proteobacteria bacterium]|nr:MBL fold metallo-hydrolase [Pseudomonadota bacterium]MDA1309105.1 MBL fold metallo-hydrolase [Pseudomonadota bacterium]